jgi:hypothetical protein
MRRSHRKPSVRKKATRRQARGGGYGAGPQSGGMIPVPPAAFIILIVVGLFLMLFITANKGALPGLEGQLPLDLVPKVVAGLFGKHGIADGKGNRVPISIDPRTYFNRTVAPITDPVAERGEPMGPDGAEEALHREVAGRLATPAPLSAWQSGRSGRRGPPSESSIYL